MRFKHLLWILPLWFSACANPIIVFIPADNNSSSQPKPPLPPPPTTTLKVQSGVASFYADRFQGNKTASGEVYDATKLTAAHKDLPFGTKVKVINRKNGKFVVVTINDRLPTSNTRLIDLSKAAAEQIEMIRDGIVEVDIQIVE